MDSQIDFGIALVALKSGKRVSRAGWNGKGMFLFLVDEWSFDVDLPATDPLNKCHPQDFICMKTANDSIVPWLASQTDILAKDWTIVG